MKLEPVTQIDQVKKDDTIIITGLGLVNHPAKAQEVLVSDSGTEIIFDKGKNLYINLGMYLKGTSWCKELAIIK
ncbi:conserved hypothetical protein [Tenacibaculum sp. 190524A02b]|uniref:Uncharacterized protein n=1 Tax=Tenacibaculum vairaonense TaxID=3137860 RepID=A0ABM9PS42_9FLAO